MFRLLNACDLLTVVYPLFQLKGELNPACGCAEVIVTVEYPSLDRHRLSWTTCGRFFKAFIPLRLGVNRILLVCLHYSAHFRLIYAAPDDGKYYVRPIYVISPGEEGKFQAPSDVACDKMAACRRIGFAMRLLQTLTAESLFAEGVQRHTFLCSDREYRLTPADSNEVSPTHVQCWLHYSNISREEWLNDAPVTVWRKLAKEIYNRYEDIFPTSKWVAFVACSRYNFPAETSTHNLTYEEMLQFSKAHFALGTGGLALLGTSTLHAWPEDLDGLQKALLDGRRIDKTDLMDDTAYRHTFWAAFATGLGSVWHELGHCFGLHHSSDGIMYRGCDDIHLCLGFTPPDFECPNGCKNGQKWNKNVVEIVPHMLHPPAPLPTILQFQQYRCLSATAEKHENVASPWGFCSSVWHQGSAFWGREQTVRLIRCPWIVVASRDADGLVAKNM